MIRTFNGDTFRLSITPDARDRAAKQAARWRKKVARQEALITARQQALKRAIMEDTMQPICNIEQPDRPPLLRIALDDYRAPLWEWAA